MTNDCSCEKVARDEDKRQRLIAKADQLRGHGLPHANVAQLTVGEPVMVGGASTGAD